MPGALTRAYQYSAERFPLQQFVPLSVLLAFSASVGTQASLNSASGNVATVCVTALALFLVFLRLRLFDEFKDREHDAIHYPSRPVPRGLVTLRQLRTAIALFLAGELAISVSRGLWSSLWFLAALGYSLLMLKEFFAREWLRKHFTVYVVSHELLLIPVLFYLYSLSGLTPQHVAHPLFWLLTLWLGAQLFLLEVTRKIRSKETEGSSCDTYTAQYGVRRTVLLVLVVAAAAVASELAIEWRLVERPPFWSYVPLPVFVGLAIVLWRFVRQPVEAHARAVLHASIWLVLAMNVSFGFTLA